MHLGEGSCVPSRALSGRLRTSTCFLQGSLPSLWDRADSASLAWTRRPMTQTRPTVDSRWKQNTSKKDTTFACHHRRTWGKQTDKLLLVLWWSFLHVPVCYQDIQNRPQPSLKTHILSLYLKGRQNGPSTIQVPSKGKAKTFSSSNTPAILSIPKTQTFKWKAKAREEQNQTLIHAVPWHSCLPWRDYLVKVSLDNSHGESAEWKQVPLRPIIIIIACHSPALRPFIHCRPEM